MPRFYSFFRQLFVAFLIGLAPFSLFALAASESHKAGDRMVIEIHGVEYPFRYCPAGTFFMGSPQSEEGRDSDETEHKVTLTESFWLLETEVTWEMWKSFPEIGINAVPEEGDQFPVHSVTWNEAQAFCRALSDASGCEATLPTEAQWEYACRAGGNKPFGESGSLDKIGWYSENCNAPQRVGQKEPNAWGFYDMQGNVWEWCADLFGMYAKGAVTDPDGAYIGGFRLIRGGAWNRGSADCRAAYRYFYFPENRLDSIGFRILLRTP